MEHCRAKYHSNIIQVCSNAALSQVYRYTVRGRDTPGPPARIPNREISVLKASLWSVVITGMLATACQTHAATSLADVQDWLTENAQAPVDGLIPGDYGQDRLADLAAYIAPGFFDKFDFPELDFELIENRPYKPHQLYQNATALHVDKGVINDSGQLEEYVAGQPFSRQAIEAASAEKAGYMVAWNQIHRWQYYGYRTRKTEMIYVVPTKSGAAGQLLDGMIGGGHVDRHVLMTYHRVYLSKLAVLPDQDYRMDVPGSDELFYKEHMEFLSPFDVAGTKFVIERPLEHARGDQINSYLASERRVRRLSAKERSDSFMGTNYTLDDFEGFSGLITDNTWRFVGRKVIPAIVNSKNVVARFQGPLSSIPLDRWQLRASYVVEAIPKWDGHPYSRRLLFVDEESFNIGMSLIFDRKDELFKVYLVLHESSDNPSEPDPALSVTRWRSSVAINLQDGSGSIARAMVPTEFPNMKPSQVKQIFSVSNLNSGR